MSESLAFVRPTPDIDFFFFFFWNGMSEIYAGVGDRHVLEEVGSQV